MAAHEVSVEGFWKQKITHSAQVSHSVTCLPEGYGALFTRDGVSSNYLQMAGDNQLPEPFLPANTSFTANTFVKFNEIVPSSDLIARWSGGGNEQFIVGFAGPTNPLPLRDTFYAVINNGDLFNVGLVQAPADLDVDVGEWFMVTFAYDFANDDLLMWVNGLPAGSATWAGGMRGVNEGMMLGGRGAAGTTFSGVLERTFLHRGVVWTDADVLTLYNGGNGIPARLLDSYGLPMPTVWYEFEDPNNVGKNWWGYTPWDLGNSENAGHTTGLVTLVPGLQSPACPGLESLLQFRTGLSFVPPPVAPLTHAPRSEAFLQYRGSMEFEIVAGLPVSRRLMSERLLIPKYPPIPSARGFPLSGDTEEWRRKFQHILSRIK